MPQKQLALAMFFPEDLRRYGSVLFKIRHAEITKALPYRFDRYRTSTVAVSGMPDAIRINEREFKLKPEVHLGLAYHDGGLNEVLKAAKKCNQQEAQAAVRKAFMEAVELSFAGRNHFVELLPEMHMLSRQRNPEVPIDYSLVILTRPDGQFESRIQTFHERVKSILGHELPRMLPHVTLYVQPGGLGIAVKTQLDLLGMSQKVWTEW